MTNHWPLVPLAPTTIAKLTSLRLHPGETLNDVIARTINSTSIPSIAQTGRPTQGLPMSRQVRFTLLGKPQTADDATEALVLILREMQHRDAGFLARLAPVVAGRKRNHIAPSQTLVYPLRPDLAEQYAVEIVPGWFLGTNIANREKQALLQKACVTAGLIFGTDLKIDLDPA